MKTRSVFQNLPCCACVQVHNWMPSTWNVQPGLYAILAATGVLGGVFRSAISLVVLMVEGTQVCMCCAWVVCEKGQITCVS